MRKNREYFAVAKTIDEAINSCDYSTLMPLAATLWPICRSITGPGVRQTLDILSSVTGIDRRRVRSGTKCFDWTVPPEWIVREAYIKDSGGNILVDFSENNLHLVGYSEPVHKKLSLQELLPHLHSLPEMPDAIPYVASYYNRTWGFCITEEQKQGLTESGEPYEVFIDSEFDENGFLDYGQSFTKGIGEKEVLLSTCVCHPSMANNELSGPIVVANLMKILCNIPDLHFSYRGLFSTETIGTIAFLSENHESLDGKIAAGYVVTCVGDDGPYNYSRSMRDDSLADRAAEHVLNFLDTEKPVRIREFDPIGSDERQYCSPGINWPIGSLTRSRHGEYPEYHTSKDDLSFISEKGIGDSINTYLRIIQVLEMNCIPKRRNPFCEYQLGQYGLYSTVVGVSVEDWVRRIIFILHYADGQRDLIKIANIMKEPVWGLIPVLEKLIEADLLTLDDVET